MCTNLQDNAQHVFYKALHMLCRGTDMERHRRNRIEDLEDCRRQSDRERRMATRQQETYIALSVWWVNPSVVLKKVRNTGSKPTFDIIYRYRHSHHLSTERLDCLLRG